MAGPDVSGGITLQFAIVTGANQGSLANVFIDDASVSVGACMNYCMANPNSTGQSGSMSVMGSMVAVNNNLTLVASSLPDNAFGFFITSLDQGFVANPNGSEGNLCLSGAIGRYVGAGQIQNSGTTGGFSLALDLTMTPTPTGLVGVSAGETRNFQAWHRDQVGGMATSNFTDGIRIVFS